MSLCVWAFFGSLCEYMVHFTFAVARYVLTKRLPRKKIGPDGPERRRPLDLEGARMRHQRPCRRPLRPERAALALWVTPVLHASSMVESRRPTTTLPSTVTPMLSSAQSTRPPP